MKVAIDLGLKDGNGNSTPAILGIPMEMYYLAKGKTATRENTVNLTAIDWESMEMQAMQQEQANNAFWQEEENIVLEVEEKKEIIPFTSLLPSSKSMSVTEFIGEEPSDEEVQQEMESLQDLAADLNITHTLLKCEERLAKGQFCFLSVGEAKAALHYNAGRFTSLARKYGNNFRVKFHNADSISAMAVCYDPSILSELKAIESILKDKAEDDHQKALAEAASINLKEVMDTQCKYQPLEAIAYIEDIVRGGGYVYLTLEQAELLVSNKTVANSLEVLLVKRFWNQDHVMVKLPSGKLQSMTYLFWL